MDTILADLAVGFKMAWPDAYLTRRPPIGATSATNRFPRPRLSMRLIAEPANVGFEASNSLGQSTHPGRNLNVEAPTSAPGI